MDVSALEAFVTVHRAGGFSKAAEALRRTQPAISRRLALLEAELGAPLFERARGGPVLSQAGRALLPYAERALAAVRDAETVVRALVTDTAGPVSLAAVGTLAGAALGPVLRAFAQAHPKADLTLRTATSAEISQLVRRGEVTIGLRYQRDPAPDLACAPLGEEALVVACAPDHPLAGRATASLASLRDERWLAFPQAPDRPETSGAHVVGLFRHHGLGEIAWTAVDSLTAQKRLAEAGFGLALVPRSAISEELATGALSTIGIGDAAPAQPVMAVTRRGGFLSAASRALLEHLSGAVDW